MKSNHHAMQAAARSQGDPGTVAWSFMPTYVRLHMEPGDSAASNCSIAAQAAANLLWGRNLDIALQPPRHQDTKENQSRNATLRGDKTTSTLLHRAVRIWSVEYLVPRRSVVPWCTNGNAVGTGGEMFGVSWELAGA